MLPENNKPIFLCGGPEEDRMQLTRLLAQVLGCPVCRLGEEFSSVTEESGASKSRGSHAACSDRKEALQAYFQKSGNGCAGIVALDEKILRDKENLAYCRKVGDVILLENQNRNEDDSSFIEHETWPCRIVRYFVTNDSLVLVGTGIVSLLPASIPTVFDSRVAELYPALTQRMLARVPSGEEHKTLATVMTLWHAFLEAGLGRKDCIAVFGGGVAGDLTGFAAATWMRGMSWINVPTTLLAMVDASTGGKTGCDLPEGKNLVGAFHFPRLVIIDTDFLSTLPERELRNGRSEMIKHRLIEMDNETMALPALTGIPSARQIADSLSVKIAIVKQDPLETMGKRLLLNCGHTIGHALETATHFSLSHGEAVAIGCVGEARLAAQMGLASRDWPEKLAKAFAQAGLPTEFPDGWNFEALLPFMKNDKKKRENTLVFALPCGWGDVRLVEYVLDK